MKKMSKEELRVVYVALETLVDELKDKDPHERYLGTGESVGEVFYRSGDLLSRIDMELDSLTDEQIYTTGVI